jgi:hypothetical protein
MLRLGNIAVNITRPARRVLGSRKRAVPKPITFLTERRRLIRFALPRGLQRLDRELNPRPYLPSVTVAAVKHLFGPPRHLGTGPGAVLADQKVGGAPNVQFGDHQIAAGSFLHHLATAPVRVAVVITRIRVVGVLSGRRCRPRARHERQQDKKCGKRQMAVHGTKPQRVESTLRSPALASKRVILIGRHANTTTHARDRGASGMTRGLTGQHVTPSAAYGVSNAPSCDRSAVSSRARPANSPVRTAGIRSCSSRSRTDDKCPSFARPTLPAAYP